MNAREEDDEARPGDRTGMMASITDTDMPTFAYKSLEVRDRDASAKALRQRDASAKALRQKRV